MCAPNDVWSLGVILVNLTCGRNPWKQASFQDSTYRAFARSPDFLKTILPVTDDLNDILGRIFNASPEQRITLPELRERILACPRLTANPLAAMPPSPPATPDQITPYVAPAEEAILDYEDSPLSPTSTISDDGSLTSSVSTLSDLDEDFVQEQQQQEDFYCAPQCVEPEIPRDFFPGPEFIPQQHYTGPVPQVHAPVPVQPPSKPIYNNPFWGVVHKYVQQVPMRQPHVPFHGQVLPSFQGCF